MDYLCSMLHAKFGPDKGREVFQLVKAAAVSRSTTAFRGTIHALRGCCADAAMLVDSDAYLPPSKWAAAMFPLPTGRVLADSVAGV